MLETKETPATTKTNSGPSTSRATRAEKRRELVAQGLERLDLWLSDLVRNGLASVESQPATFWEQQAAQMIDAQAPGIAARLRSMAGKPNSPARWPEGLLGQLGRLALRPEAFP